MKELMNQKNEFGIEGERMTTRNLLIVGAGSYSIIAYEIAQDMGCFDKIDFIDKTKIETLTHIPILGHFSDLVSLSEEFTDIIVSIGNPDIRLNLLKRIEEETNLKICRLISPRAYVSKSAHVSRGCIIEPMAVVHSLCKIGRGSIISSGAVVNHESICGEGVHVNCNATVASYANVPAKRKIDYGEVYI